MSKKRTKKQVKENKKLKLSVKRTLKYMFGARWRKSGLYRLYIRKARKHEFRRHFNLCHSGAAAGKREISFHS